MLNSRKNLGIVLLTNEKYLFACGTMIINILDKIEDFANIIVYHESLSDESCKSLIELDRRVILREFGKNEFRSQFPFVSADLLKSNYFTYYSSLNAVKFMSFKLLSEYEQILLLDTDMLLIEAIPELFSDKDANVIWRNDHTSIGAKLKFCGWTGNDDEISAYKDITTPNGGFFILNNNFDFNKAFETAKKFFEMACEKHPLSLNETTLGYTINCLNLKVRDIDTKIYNVFPEQYNRNSKLIHFLERYKPWSFPLVQYMYPQWLSYYKEFSRRSQRSFDAVKFFSSQGQTIMDSTTSRIWADIIPKLNSCDQLLINPCQTGWTNRLYFTSTIWIQIDLVYGFLSCKVSLQIDKAFADSFPDIINFIKNYNDEMIFQEELNIYKLITPILALDKIPKFIFSLLDVCNHINRLMVSVYNESRFYKGMLKTYFNKYLSSNCEQLIQSSPEHSFDKIIALRMEDIIAFQVPDGRYVRYLTTLGRAKLSKSPCFFRTKKNGDRIQIVMQHMHLSARDDSQGSIHLVPQARNWESFSFEPLAQPKICLSPSEDSALPEAALARLSRLCIPVNQEISEDPKKLADMLAVSGLFNAKFYIANNSDVAEAKIDPLIHYAAFGWREHRDPAPWFCCDFYREHNQDVDFNAIDPFLHYIARGYGEGRACSPMKAE